MWGDFGHSLFSLAIYIDMKYNNSVCSNIELNQFLEEDT